MKSPWQKQPEQAAGPQFRVVRTDPSGQTKVLVEVDPEEQMQPEVIRCDATRLRLVLAKLRRMGRPYSEPVSVGLEFEIAVGVPADKPLPLCDDDRQWTFGAPRNQFPI